MKKGTRTRRILPPPNPAAHRHLVAAARSLAKAEEARARLRFKMEEPSRHALVSTRRAFERKLEDEMWEASNPYRQSIKEIEKEFRARWFVWRSLLPISLISSIPCEEILVGRANFRERALAIWLARQIGDLGYIDLGKVVDRDHTSVLSSCRRVEDALEAREPGFWNLLQDVIYLEEFELCP